jgi:hypothetical protein
METQKSLFNQFQTYKKEVSFNPSFITSFWKIFIIYLDPETIPELLDQCIQKNFVLKSVVSDWARKQVFGFGSILLLHDKDNPYYNLNNQKDSPIMKQIQNFEYCVFNTLQNTNLNIQIEALLRWHNFSSCN